MKLTIERNAFLKALNHTQNVVERKTTLPILSHILLDADGVSLKISATDLELSLIEKVSAIVVEPGRTTIPAHLLYEIVRKLPDGAKVELSINETKNYVQIVSGRSDFNLPCLPPEDFPQINMVELPHRFNLGAQTCRDLLEKTRFAMSNDETRYFLNGIYLHVINDKELAAVATDGHRLCKVVVPLPAGAKDIPGVIISRKTVIELSKIIADTHDDVAIGISDTQFSCTVGNAYFISRLVDGKFPNYEEAIPKDNDKEIRIPVKKFAQAVDRVATISTDKVPGVYLDFDKGRIALSAIGTGSGAAYEEIEIKYNNKKVNIGLGSNYILDAAQHINDEEMRLQFSDGDSPVIIQEGNNNNTLYLIMPLRV